MKSTTKTTWEQNNSKPLEIQKIEKQILFGKTGPWTKYFRALLFFGIDVKGLQQENYELKNKIDVLQTDLIKSLKKNIDRESKLFSALNLKVV